MCGIAGVYWGDRPSSVAEEVVARMVEVIHHRGPDSSGRRATDFADVGFRRLAIIDLAGGDQPLRNEDGTVECFLNGEIYNYRELRRELQAAGHRFYTGSDTEVLPHLYEELGEEFLGRLNGMFTICLIDHRKRSVIVARDQVGVKQMYYSVTPHGTLFGSEMKAVLAAGLFEPRLDRAGVLAYLTLFYSPEPHTLVEGVRKIPPGTFLLLTPGAEATLKRYYAPAAATHEEISDGCAVGRVKELLTEAVRLQLQADVPLGISLSGGLDSTAIACAAKQSATGDLLAFTVDYPDTPRDEVSTAARLSKHLGIKHEVLAPDMQDVVQELPLLAWMSDEPNADPALYSQFCIARAARKHVTVLLSGTGGDELFGGYPSYFLNWKRAAVAGFPATVQRFLWAVGATASLGPDQALALQSYRQSRLRWHCQAMSSLTSSDQEALARYLGTSRDPYENFRTAFALHAHRDAPSQQMQTDLRSYLPDQTLPMLDRATMAASVEGRVPFLDVNLVNFTGALSGRTKLGMPGAPKRLLRDVVDSWLPWKFNSPKRGLPSPAANLVADHYHDVCPAILFGRDSVIPGLVPVRWVKEMLQSRASAVGNFRVIYSLLVLEVWHKLMIRSRSYARPAMPLYELYDYNSAAAS